MSSVKILLKKLINEEIDKRAKQHRRLDREVGRLMREQFRGRRLTESQAQLLKEFGWDDLRGLITKGEKMTGDISKFVGGIDSTIAKKVGDFADAMKMGSDAGKAMWAKMSGEEKKAAVVGAKKAAGKGKGAAAAPGKGSKGRSRPGATMKFQQLLNKVGVPLGIVLPPSPDYGAPDGADGRWGKQTYLTAKKVFAKAIPGCKPCQRMLKTKNTAKRNLKRLYKLLAQHGTGGSQEI